MEYEMIDIDEMEFKPVADQAEVERNYPQMNQLAFEKAVECFREVHQDKWMKEYYENEFLVTFPDGRSTRFTLTVEDIFDDDI